MLENVKVIIIRNGDLPRRGDPIASQESHRA